MFQNELNKRDLDHIVEKLSERASQTGSDGVVGQNTEATQRVQYFCAVAEAVKRRQAARTEQNIALSPMAGTSKAVLQTVSLQVCREVFCGEDRTRSCAKPL